MQRVVMLWAQLGSRNNSVVCCENVGAESITSVVSGSQPPTKQFFFRWKRIVFMFQTMNWLSEMKLCEHGHVRWDAKCFLAWGDPSQAFNGSQIVCQNDTKQGKQPQEFWSSSSIKQFNGVTLKILNVTLTEVLDLFLWL